MQLTEDEEIAIAVLIIAAALGVFIIFKPKKTAIMTAGSNAFKQALVQNALAELNAWDYGVIKEGDPKTMDRIRAYWKEGAGVKNWDDQKMVSEAWSAALISYLMKKSGAGNDFKYSPSHSVYLREAIKNRKENNANPFKGYKPEEMPIAVGDLVGRPRQTGVTYDTTSPYLSHSDMVIGIKDGFADTVGGNVSNSVKITKVPLTADGKIDNSKVHGEKYFVVVKNNK